MKIKDKIMLGLAAEWTDSSIKSGDPLSCIESISTDTRKIKSGDYFIPIRGENFDGHDFIGDAVRKGASGFVYEKNKRAKLSEFLDGIGPDNKAGSLILETDNTMDFMKMLASNYLMQFNVKIIGITGSVGKTTTKNMIAAVLSKKFETVSTPGNYNTEIGISKSIFNVGPDTDYFVAELGMRGRNQIGPLAEIINVEIAAITAVGDSHMEFFKSQEEIAEAKAEIAVPLEKNRGRLFLNADDSMTPYIRQITGVEIIEFGEDNCIDYNFIETGADSRGRFSFDLFKKDKKVCSIKSSIPGYHNLYNECLAAAICHYTGADISMIKDGIENIKIEEHRMQLIDCCNFIIIDDCYNASPISVTGAIDTLLQVSVRNNRRSVAILGDMLELGKSAKELHYKVGQYCAERGIEILIAVGKLAKNFISGFRDFKNKKTSEKYFYFNNKNGLVRSLDAIVEPGDIILVKGSRANKMEDIISFLNKQTGVSRISRSWIG
jgi:UDP-N-acetylmuramoyl-tripeptide--D-alanyl-D-alanine ligase